MNKKGTRVGRFTVGDVSDIFPGIKNQDRRFNVSELIAKLDSAIAEVKGRFDKEQEKEKDLAQKRADLDRAIAVSREEQVRLQGEYRALETMKVKESEPVKTEQPN